jgi:hypothetical protein
MSRSSTAATISSGRIMPPKVGLLWCIVCQDDGQAL